MAEKDEAMAEKDETMAGELANKRLSSTKEEAAEDSKTGTRQYKKRGGHWNQYHHRHYYNRQWMPPRNDQWEREQEESRWNRHRNEQRRGRNGHRSTTTREKDNGGKNEKTEQGAGDQKKHEDSHSTEQDTSVTNSRRNKYRRGRGRNDYRRTRDQIEVETQTERTSIKQEKKEKTISDPVTLPAHSYGKERKMATFSSSLQSEELSQQLLSGAYECAVCCDRVRQHQEVWSCQRCYHIFHLRCIRRWAHSLSAAANEEHPEEGWRCPTCQNTVTIIPSIYRCFCGRVVNPGQSRKKGDLTVPHSCGEVCHRRLASSLEAPCLHKCSQLCHPGQCPPCPMMVFRKCPCGKLSSHVRCSQYDILPSCGSICGRILNCGLHKCTAVCHEGLCGNCDHSIETKCYCKRQTKSMLCGEVIEFSCGKLCNKPLSCGNHTCEAPCHPGNCSSCSLLPDIVSHCPCGAKPISELLPEGSVRTSCLDDVPLCDNVCSKPLPCSMYSGDTTHLCTKLCHTGDCPPCTLVSVALCRCGQSHEKVPCTQVSEREGFICSRNCGKKLNCGRHRCQNKCCVSDSHVCERVCGRKHDCGRHSCREVCHLGRCGPCWNVSYEELTCHCGGEVMLPPIPCGTAPPPCSRPCARMHSCTHPVTHSCHSEDTCPPCTHLTDKMCMGGHILRNYIPCHLKDVSCGKSCGRSLSCEMHSCRRICHKGACEREGEKCTQACTLERKYCSHICGAPCHVGSSCPDHPCKAKVTIKCSCGRRKEEVLCLASGTAVTSQAFQKLYSEDLSSLMREIQSGQSVKIDSVSMKTAQERKLDCDELCAQIERNRKFAEALDLTDVDYSPNTAPLYSSFLLEQAKTSPSLVSHVEGVFLGLYEAVSGKKTGQSTTHHFKPMKQDQRRLIHELAEVYLMTSVSYDAEPLRNVVVTATKKSILPYQTLSEIVSSSRLMPAPVPLRLVPKPAQTQAQTFPDYFNDDV